MPHITVAANGGGVSPQVTIGRANLIPDDKRLFRGIRTSLQDVHRIVEYRNRILSEVLRRRYHYRLGSIHNTTGDSTVITTIRALIRRRATGLRTSRDVTSREIRHNVRHLIVARVLTGCRVLKDRRHLTTCMVKVRPFPTTERNATIRSGRRAIIINVTRGLLMRARNLLLIATRRICFSALRALTLRPTRLLLTNGKIVRPISKALLCVIPMAAKTVPRRCLRALTANVLSGLFRTITASIIIPPIIGRCVFMSRNNYRIGVTRLIIMISTTILPRGPTPYTATQLMVVNNNVT